MVNEIYEMVLKYRKHGWSIFPVNSDKKPLVEWKKYQTEFASDEQLEEWFNVKNPPNIGVATGEISNLTVVDVEKGGKWEHYPVTLTSRTGGGGVHLFYRHGNVQNSTRIHPLTDIRGNGGCIVLPPSLHHSGAKYEWIRKEDEQPFPYQMFNLSPNKNTDWEKLLVGTAEGSRNETASKVIGKFLSATSHKDWHTVAWDMTVLWNQRNKPPLGEKELRSTFNSIVSIRLRTGKLDDVDSRNPEAQVNQDDCEIKLISEIANSLSDDITISYPTGFKEYDDAFMGGVKEGDLVFVTGYTGQGKTLFLQSLAFNFEKSGQPTLFFSYEVMIGELWRKFKEMGAEDTFQAYAPEKNTIRKLDWIHQKIKDARDRFKTKIILIDHLGFLVEDPKNYDANLASNYASVLTAICRRLKTIAIDEGVIILLAGHVKKPLSSQSNDATLHDIKDSSGPGQESDAVVIVSRKKFFASSAYGKGQPTVGDTYGKETFIKIDKNRRTGQNKVFEVSYQKGRLVDYRGQLEGFVGELNNQE